MIMAENLNTEADKYALYFPSIQLASAESIVDADIMRDGQAPKKLRGTDFNYLNPKNPHWHYKYCLATAEEYKGKDGNAVSDRDAASIVMGDSGGYQIGTGDFGDTAKWLQYQNEPETIMALWRSSYIREEVLRWQQAQCDIAMTMDMPLWAMQDWAKKSPFHKLTRQQLTELTVENLQYISATRRVGSCKLLNVLQGDNDDDEDYWYNAVRHYGFEGWAFAGGVGRRGGIRNSVRMFLRLAEDGLLNPPYNWVHMLGLSIMTWCPILTQIQMCVREKYNSNFTISFDSSGAYQQAGKFNEYFVGNTFGANLKEEWTMPPTYFPSYYTVANELVPLPLNKNHTQYKFRAMTSPIAKKLTLQDLCVNKSAYAKRIVDDFSAEVLINHNVYTYAKSTVAANQAVFVTRTAPDKMLAATDVIVELFNTADWRTLLKDKTEILEAAARA